MGQRNTPFDRHMIDLEADQPGQDYIHPEPCVFYGHAHTLGAVPTLGNVDNIFLNHLPEGPEYPHDRALFYGMPYYNNSTIHHHHHPSANIDLAIAMFSNHYNNNPYMATRDFPIPVNYATHDQNLPFSSTHGIAGNIDSNSVQGSFKRKIAEGFHGNLHHYPAMGASSSSVSPMISNDNCDSLMFAEDGSMISFSGLESVAHISHGNYGGQSFQHSGNPQLDLQFSGNGGHGETWAWNQGAPLPYMHGNIGGCVDGRIMGVQGYQVHPPIPQGHSNGHHLLPSFQGMMGHNNINFSPQMATSSWRYTTNGSSTSNINPFPGAVEGGGPRYIPPFSSTGLRLCRPRQRDFMLETNNMGHHHNFPNVRVLPDDGVAMLEIPGYGEIGNSDDQHRDMRLDIDHMSYEELLALGDQIGSVTTGLSEEAIISHLKTKRFTLPATTSSSSEGAECMDQETDFCVICQNGYVDQENIGRVECGHEYHVDCIKKWLIVKNSCPICKSSALSTEQKDS